ncbi:MAG: hypothetical protein GY791_18010 [Alphaproteobacteria bacterium]|nr:hypothetical protein [Alphaproteobacteria bacterium]
MATLKERIENHPAVFFLGAIVLGFLAGISAYQTVLEISNQTTVSRNELTALRKDLKILEEKAADMGAGQEMSPISYDMDRHGDDFDGPALPTRFPGQCQDKCRDIPECKAWAYEPPNKCWLKKGKPSEQSRPGFASGVKRN